MQGHIAAIFGVKQLPFTKSFLLHLKLAQTGTYQHFSLHGLRDECELDMAQLFD
jgi:hypothetical protein